MQKRASALSRVVLTITVPGVCGIFLVAFSGAARLVAAAATILGMVLILIVRGVHRACTSRFCYICRSRIAPEVHTNYECPRCGNHACSSCLLLLDPHPALCFSCARNAERRHNVTNAIAFICVIIAVLITLCVLTVILSPGIWRLLTFQSLR